MQGKTLDVGERPRDRKDESRKSTAAAEDPLVNIATKTKKGGKRKKEKKD
jgi:hypothetical protein